MIASLVERIHPDASREGAVLVEVMRWQGAVYRGGGRWW